MNKLLAPLLKEPAVVLGAVCGACVFLLTRYLSIDDSTAHQIVYAVVPFLFSAITRQFVTPVAKTAPAVAPGEPVGASTNVNSAAKTTTLNPAGTPTGNYNSASKPNETDMTEPAPPIL